GAGGCPQDIDRGSRRCRSNAGCVLLLRQHRQGRGAGERDAPAAKTRGDLARAFVLKQRDGYLSDPSARIDARAQAPALTLNHLVSVAPRGQPACCRPSHRAIFSAPLQRSPLPAVKVTLTTVDASAASVT